MTVAIPRVEVRIAVGCACRAKATRLSTGVSALVTLAKAESLLVSMANQPERYRKNIFFLASRHVSFPFHLPLLEP